MNWQKRLVFAAFTSGVLLSLAWIGVSGLVLLIAFVPLLFVENELAERKNKISPIVFWGYSFITFLIWNVVSTWWIGYATIIGAVVAIVVNSMLMSIVWWSFHLVHRIKNDFFAYLFLLVCWSSFELLQFNWDMSWPWLTLGNGLANDIWFIQWYEFTGVFGGTWWILLVNILLSRFVILNLLNGKPLKPVWLIGSSLVLVVPVVISLIRYQNYTESVNPVKVVLLQPNIDPYQDKFNGLTNTEQYDQLFHLVDSIGDESVDFFIGPETAFHDVWLDRVDSNEAVERTLKVIETLFPNSAFIMGAMTFYPYPSAKEATATARIAENGLTYFDIYNSALFINGYRSVDVYNKTNLVSGVEKMPFGEYLQFLEPLMINLGGTTGSLGASQKQAVFVKDSTVIGVPICFESVFGEFVSAFVKSGANILVVITNDGWWKNSMGYKQHLSYSKILAVSHRRSVARAGNTGISCLINQRGDVLAQTNWWTRTALKGEINRNNKVSFYSRNGDFLARLGSAVLIVLLLVLIVEKFIKEKNRINPE